MTEGWTRLTADACAGVRLTRHCAASDGNYMYLVGGSNNDESKCVWRSASGENWTLLTDAAPWEYASDGILLSCWGYLWFIVGGTTPQAPHVVYRSSDGIAWTKVLEGNIGSSDSLDWGGFVSGAYMYVVLVDSAEVAVLRMYRSTDGVTWEKLGDDWQPPTSAYLEMNKISVAFDGTNVFVQVSDDAGTGGDDTSYVFKGTLAGTWESLTETPEWGYRHWTTLFYHSGSVLAMGGVDHYGGDPRVWYNDVWTSADGAIYTSTGNAGWSARLPVVVSHGGALFVVGCWDAESEEPAPPGPYPLVDVWRLGDYTAPPRTPIEREWWTFACTPYGSLRDPSLTVAHDFTRALVFDLALGKVYPAWGFPMASVLNNSSPCAGPAQTPTGMFAGTTDGYIAKLMGPDCYGLGTPCRRVAWPLDGGCTSRVLKVLLAEDGDFLPTGGG